MYIICTNWSAYRLHPSWKEWHKEPAQTPENYLSPPSTSRSMISTFGEARGSDPYLIGRALIYASCSSKLSYPSLKSQKNLPKSFSAVFIGLT